MDPRWGLVICFGAPVVVFGVFMLGLYLVNLPYSRRMDRIEQRILAEGRFVKAWIVVANPALYKRSRTEVWNVCQVVFTFDDHLPDLDQRLEAIAANVRNLDLDVAERRSVTDDESQLVSVMSSNVPYTKRLRVPDRLTDGLKTYSASVYVQRRHLPDRRLELPYILCKALPRPEHDEESSLVMVPYVDAT